MSNSKIPRAKAKSGQSTAPVAQNSVPAPRQGQANSGPSATAVAKNISDQRSPAFYGNNVNYWNLEAANAVTIQVSPQLQQQPEPPPQPSQNHLNVPGPKRTRSPSPSPTYLAKLVLPNVALDENKKDGYIYGSGLYVQKASGGFYRHHKRSSFKWYCTKTHKKCYGIVQTTTTEISDKSWTAVEVIAEHTCTNSTDLA